MDIWRTGPKAMESPGEQSPSPIAGSDGYLGDSQLFFYIIHTGWGPQTWCERWFLNHEIIPMNTNVRYIYHKPLNHRFFSHFSKHQLNASQRLGAPKYGGFDHPIELIQKYVGLGVQVHRAFGYPPWPPRTQKITKLGAYTGEITWRLHWFTTIGYIRLSIVWGYFRFFSVN